MHLPNINRDTLKLLGGEADKFSKRLPISQPSFSGVNGMMTKTEPVMSEDKYKESIIELAKKDAANGEFGGNKNASYMVLKKSFVSVVSPDRRSVITAALRQVPFMQQGKVSYLNIKDSGGNTVVTFSGNNGWHSIGSKAEIQRESEFDAIYTGALREATNAMKNAASQSISDSTGGSIDVSV